MFQQLKKQYYAVLVSGFALLLGTMPLATQALNWNPSSGDPTKTISSTTGSITLVNLGKNTPTAVALDLINLALSLLAGLCVVLLLYAGFLWLWARGNADEVKKAKDIIVGTIIGLVIVLASLGITTYVFTAIVDITGATVTQ